MSGAPIGNQNARKGKIFQSALKRALARASGESVDAGLDKGAEQLVKAYHAGEAWAIKEVRDTLDGKPAQVIAGDDELPPVKMEGVVRLVKPTEGGV